MTKKKPYNGNTWTDARFRSFITSALRAATRRWGPKAQALKDARRARGIYLCAGYKRRNHKVPLSIKQPGKKATRNVFVDHIAPVVDPSQGFTTWDEYIERMFVEVKGFQVLCKQCHDEKTKQERQERNASKSRK